MPLEFPTYSALTKEQYQDSLQHAIEAEAVRQSILRSEQMADKQARYLRPRVVRSPWVQMREWLWRQPYWIEIGAVVLVCGVLVLLVAALVRIYRGA